MSVVYSTRLVNLALISRGPEALPPRPPRFGGFFMGEKL